MPVRGGRGSGAEVLMATEGQRSPVPPRAVAVSKQDSLVGKRACSSGRTPRLPSLSASTGAEACRRPEVLLPPGNTGAFPLCVRLRHLQRSHVVTAKPPVSRPTGEAQVSRALSLVLKQESGTREESTRGGRRDSYTASCTRRCSRERSERMDGGVFPPGRNGRPSGAGKEERKGQTHSPSL